jgi:hypothetical protein
MAIQLEPPADRALVQSPEGLVDWIVLGWIVRICSNPVEGSSFHPVGLVASLVGALIVVMRVRLAERPSYLRLRTTAPFKGGSVLNRESGGDTRWF